MGLFTKSVSIEVRDLLTTVRDMLQGAVANEKFYLVSPYLKLDRMTREVIGEAADRNVNVRLLLRSGERIENDDAQFLANSKVDVRTHEYLHAKVYWFPEACVITSLNLYDTSDRRNREIGVVLTSSSDIREVEGILDDWWNNKSQVVSKSELIKLGKHQAPEVVVSRSKSSADSSTSKGYCIRCGKQKTYNPQYPHCDDCYKEWSKYKNPEYAEKKCHRCGEANKTSKDHPLCRDCYKLDPFDKAASRS